MNDKGTGYIIHERSHIEKKKYVVLLTPNQGICSTAIPTRTKLSFFTTYQITYHPKHQRPQLKSPLEHTHPLRGRRLYCGLYINELIYQLCKPGDGCTFIFKSYQEIIGQLMNGTHYEAALRTFELSLIKALGYGIDTSPIKAEYARFHVSDGLEPCFRDTRGSVALKTLQMAINGEGLIENSASMKQFTRYVFASLLPKDLNSRLFYEKV